MKAVLRVDGSAQLGNGHISRCLTLAKALRQQGFSCLFILQPLPGILHDAVLQADFHCEWLAAGELSQAEDARQSLVLAARYFKSVQALEILWIVDVYSLDADWHRCIRSQNQILMVIDDLANRKYCADFLLDQTPLRQQQDYGNKINESCELFLGAGYALLHGDFNARQASARKQRATDLTELRNKLLISLGGTDPHNYSADIVQALLVAPVFSAWRITLVFASNAPHLNAVQQLCKPYHNICVLINVKNMADLLMEQNIAVGAAGVSALERASLGLPSVNFITADNQMVMAENLAKQGCAINLGVCNLRSILQMCDYLLQLASDNNCYQAVSNAGFAVSNGLGAEIIATRLHARYKSTAH